MTAEKKSLDGPPFKHLTTFDIDPEHDGHHRVGRELNIERVRSLPRRSTSVEPGAKLPTEFRTLSIQIHETRENEQSAKVNSSKTAKDLVDLDWHTISIDEVTKRLGTSTTTGLDGPQALRRLKSGKNVMSKPPRNLARKIFVYVFGGFGTLLFVASILCFVAWKPLGEPAPQASNLALAVVLLIVVVLQAGFNAWQDFSTSRVMASITNMLPAEVRVIRDGSATRVAAPDLVKGDLVDIMLGQKIPADLRLVATGGDMRFDRSVLTGESDPIVGTVDATSDNFLETQNVALAGTLCVSGGGQGIVIQTGDATVFGRIAKLSSRPNNALTTLEREIYHFVLMIAGLAIATGVLICILWGAWLKKDHPGFITVSGLLINVVSVAVAFIPEGLPVAVTLSLAKVASTLAKHKVLCKTLSTVETLGAVNVICSDKTGTLTEGKMTVTRCYLYSDDFSAQEARDRTVMGGDRAEGVKQIQLVAGLCNASKFESDDTEKKSALKKVSGDATDAAIFRFADTVSSVTDVQDAWTEIYAQAFNSKTKYALKLMSPKAPIAPTVGTEAISTQDYVLMCKGAPDVLLKRCGSVLDPASGTSLPLTAETISRITATQEHWSTRGQRVILLARRVISKQHLHFAGQPSATQAFADAVTKLTVDLQVVGLLGLIDPPRHDTPETIRICREAGIRVFMVTGDFSTTACAIAAQCGIVSDINTVHRLSDLDYKGTSENSLNHVGALVLDGTDLMSMNESQWEQACQYKEVVFARTSPEQKLRIVKELQARQNIVAMTGDGVNDAPSLKAANIGVAMGSGSDVAMEAADMVLLETFSSIVVAIEYGRLVYDNLRKTILYLLPAGSFSELMPVLLNVLFGLPQALSNLQMIIICVGTDVAPALSLCLEKPEADLLTRPPRDPKKDKLANPRLMLHAYAFCGILESLAAMSMAFWWFQRRGIRFSQMWLSYGNVPDVDPAYLLEVTFEAQTVYFFTLVIMQWGNLLSVRTRKLSIVQQPPIGSKRTRNIFLFPSMFIALAVAVFFSYIRFFNDTFSTRHVAVQHWFLPLGFGAGLLAIDEARKFIVRRYPKSILAWLAW